jgi:DNA-directed RNA polymerase subunit K/omega
MSVTRFEEVLLISNRTRDLIDGAPASVQVKSKDKEIMIALREYEQGKIDVQARVKQIIDGMLSLEQHKNLAMEISNSKLKQEHLTKNAASLDFDMIRLFEDVTGYHDENIFIDEGMQGFKIEAENNVNLADNEENNEENEGFDFKSLEEEGESDILNIDADEDGGDLDFSYMEDDTGEGNDDPNERIKSKKNVMLQTDEKFEDFEED